MNKELLDICLGYCKSDKFVVLLGHHPNPSLVPVTSAHEHQHHHLNTTTGYGLLMVHVARCMTDVKKVKDGKAILKFLVEKSTIVHEMYATYVSLSLLKKQQLITSNPKLYQQCFNQMRSAVEPVFDTTMLRCRLASAIARTAMMNSAARLVSDQILKNKRFSPTRILTCLPESEWPDSRIRTISEDIGSLSPLDFRSIFEAKLPPLESRLLFRYDTEDELATNLAATEGDMNRIMGSMEKAMLFSVFEVVEHQFPDIRRNYWEYMSIRSLLISLPALHQFPNEFKRHDGLLLDILGRCSQVVKVVDTPAFEPRTMRGNPNELERVFANSLCKLGAVFAYVQRDSAPKHESGLKLFLSDVVRTQDKCILKRYHLNSSECAAFQRIAHEIEIMTIIEEEDLLATQDRERVYACITELLSRHAFVHVNRNPIEFINSYLEAGYSITWSSYKLGYAKGSIHENQGLQVCLYRQEGALIPFFHLSNITLTNAIVDYTQKLVADPSKLAYEDPDEFANSLGTRILSLLGDHPIINYYLAGTKPD